ncbi:TPA: phosphohistidine phosphatase SixA [Legionella pneumophila]|nr:phosphohistidine phosphatase SixA [Legionella pneumophila]
MKIYLVQNGDSLDKDIDPERPLSDQGQKDIQLLSNFLSLLKIEVSCVYHSGKLRAQQTAESLSDHIFSKNGVESRAGLDPLDDVIPLAKEINQLKQNMMFVGHLPFMNKLVSQLVAEEEHRILVSFKPGSLVCLDKADGINWCIAWMICPELLRE